MAFQATEAQQKLLDRRTNLLAEINSLREQMKATGLYQAGQTISYGGAEYLIERVFVQWDRISYGVRKLKKDGTPHKLSTTLSEGQLTR